VLQTLIATMTGLIFIVIDVSVNHIHAVTEMKRLIFWELV